MRNASRLLVNLSRLADNYQELVKLCPNNDILFMVKADAYGHGLVPISNFCNGELGIREFGCASLAEGVHLRQRLEGEGEIYIFSETCLGLEDCYKEYLEHRLIPIIASLGDLKVFLKQKDFSRVPLCLKFNTGMSRLGIEISQVEDVIAACKREGRKTISHVMTHYACAAYPIDSNQNNIAQSDLFQEVKCTIRATGMEFDRSSISGSGAIEQGAGLDESHVRPGLMLYGASALVPEHRGKSRWQGRIISTLETSILHLFDVSEGTAIGYHSVPCPRDGLMVLVALGYGDGFSTGYSGITISHGRSQGEVVGVVSMDMAYILFDRGTNLKVGDKISIWDEDRDRFMTISDQSGVIPNEIFCQISSRVPRVYVGK